MDTEYLLVTERNNLWLLVPPLADHTHSTPQTCVHSSAYEEAGGYVTWEGFAEKFNEETVKNACAQAVYDCCKEAG